MAQRIKAEVNPNYLSAVPVGFPRSAQVTSRILACIALFAGLLSQPSQAAIAGGEFIGKHYQGSGDIEYLRLLDTARRFFEPDPELENLSMLYEPSWNGLVEGPTWDAWWIQNSYGGSYCWLPFAVEPWSTFIANSQGLWFQREGDGKTKDTNGYTAPDGCLVDAANLTKWYYRQGDGRHDI